VKPGARELAEAMAAEGLEAATIKRVLLNLGFSHEEVVRAVARAYIVTGMEGREGPPPLRGGEAERASSAREGDGKPLLTADGRGLAALERRLSVLEERVAALINLLTEYVPTIAEKVSAGRQRHGGV